MKANSGGTVTGQGIIGRSVELEQIWTKIAKRSILLSAERRVGKTSLLRKMQDESRAGWTPLLVFVESARHPIDCVEAIHEQATASQLRSKKGVGLKRIRQAYEALSSSQLGGWKLPQLQANWRTMLRSLVEDIVEHSDTGALIMIDEFPLMI